MNMSYCRFYNTAIHLSDCLTALMELKEGESDPLSRSELEGAKSLVGDCLRVVELLINDQLENKSCRPLTAQHLLDEIQSINDEVEKSKCIDEEEEEFGPHFN